MTNWLSESSGAGAFIDIGKYWILFDSQQKRRGVETKPHNLFSVQSIVFISDIMFWFCTTLQ